MNPSDLDLVDLQMREIEILATFEISSGEDILDLLRSRFNRYGASARVSVLLCP